MLIELSTGEIPLVFEKFKVCVGESHWLRRVALLKQEIRGNTFLESHLKEENEIAFNLEKYSDSIKRYGGIPFEMLNDRSLYQTITFVAQAISIIEQASQKQKIALVRRIHGAFKNPADFRAMQLEFVAATHFIKKGHSIIWPEMEGTGTFDIYVKDVGLDGIEVECKSISQDKGHKIHRRDALDFQHLVSKELSKVKLPNAYGLNVICTFDGRLPTEYKNRCLLAKNIRLQIQARVGKLLEDGVEILINEFDPTLISDISSERFNYDLIEKITGVQNSFTMIIKKREQSPIILTIKSRQDNSLLKYIFETVSTSARTQLSKNRAAHFLISLHGISIDQMQSLAQQDFNDGSEPTSLRIAVSQFLNGKERDHVVGVGFLSKESLEIAVDGSVKNACITYNFPKIESPFWNDEFLNLFET